MRRLITILVLVVLFIGAQRGFGQAFTNLNFESANLSGYSTNAEYVPISAALPGWAASFSDATGETDAVTEVWYNNISLAGQAISINQFSPNFPGGRFDVSLFGGTDPGFGEVRFFSATISQTGMVPAGTESLRLQVWGAPPIPSYPHFVSMPIIIVLGGETIYMVPLATSPTYTLYGGDVSAFAGQVETLSITEPPPTSELNPSIAVIDNIMFSTLPAPEPGTMGLLGAGVVMMGLRRWQKK